MEIDKKIIKKLVEVLEELKKSLKGEIITEDNNGCISDTTFFNVEWLPSSIENTNIDNLSIYPNPSKGIFIIELNNLITQNLEIRVLNSIGEIVYLDDKKQHTGKYKQEINLRDYAKGIYFLEIETQQGLINQKIISQ